MPEARGNGRRGTTMKKYGSFSTDDENVLELESDDDCITL